MGKKTKFKVGDIVRSNEHIGIWELVWYKTGDTTCAIQNHNTRALAKVSQLNLIVEDEGIEKLPTQISTDKEWMVKARQNLDELNK